MNALKWIARARSREDYRPALGWGHVVTYSDERIMWATDGYRVHLTWEFEKAMPDLIPFHDSVSLGSATLTPPKIQPILENYQRRTHEVTFNTKSLAETLAAFRAKDFNFVQLRFEYDKDVYMASKTHLAKLQYEQWWMPDAPELPCLTPQFDVKYLKAAIDLELETTTLSWVGANDMLFVGTWGKQLAIIASVNQSVIIQRSMALFNHIPELAAENTSSVS